MVWQGRQPLREHNTVRKQAGNTRDIRANPLKPRDLQVDAQLTPRRCAVN